MICGCACRLRTVRSDKVWTTALLLWYCGGGAASPDVIPENTTVINAGAILGDEVCVSRLAADDGAAFGVRSEVTAIVGGACAEVAMSWVQRTLGKAPDIGGT